MTTLTSVKEFTSLQPFKGQEVLEIIKAHDLYDYEVRSITREFVSPSNNAIAFNQWKYVLVFGRLDR